MTVDLIQDRRCPRFLCRATVKDGKLEDSKPFEAYLSRFNGVVNIIVQKYKRTRSNKQNRAYWKLLEILSDEIKDYSAPQFHEIFKALHAPKALVMIGEIELTINGTTTKMSTVQFTDYMERIRSTVSEVYDFTLPSIDEISAIEEAESIFYS